MFNRETQVKTVSFFADLDAASISAIASATEQCTIEKHEVIFREGDEADGMYLIQSGAVKVFVDDENGHELTLFVENTNGYFGEASLINDSVRTASVSALEPTHLLKIPKAAFIACIEKHPQVARNIASLTTERLRRATDLLRSLALENVYERLTHKLQELAVSTEDGAALQRKFSHQEFANMIGASREMVGKILSDLSKGGYIETREGIIHLVKKLPHAW